jgi:hypothetical protein
VEEETVNDWVRELPTFDRVEEFRGRLACFADELSAAQRDMLELLVRSALTATASHAGVLGDGLPALLAELSPVTFAHHRCPKCPAF